MKKILAALAIILTALVSVAVVEHLWHNNLIDFLVIFGFIIVLCFVEAWDQILKSIAIALITLTLFGTAQAQGVTYSLACNPPSSGGPTLAFYYLTGLPSGTVATYTATLPTFQTFSGGLALAPDSTGVTGFTVALPSTWAAGTLTGTAIACTSAACSTAVTYVASVIPGSPGGFYIFITPSK